MHKPARITLHKLLIFHQGQLTIAYCQMRIKAAPDEI
jgi:hypothetical protein